MEAHRVESVVESKGRVLLENLPFEEGKTVEIIILEANEKGVVIKPNPIKGSLLKYDNPFEPACPPEDWEALR
jgi:hypothetical protein